MPAIVIEADLYSQVQERAAQHQVTIDQLFQQAVRQHLWELDRRKISQESQFYRQQHAELKQEFLGQYIAMHHGQVVDHAPDFLTLRQRVRQNFGRVPIMITLVAETAESALTRQGFIMEKP